METAIETPRCCVRCGEAVSYWIDAGWVHDERQKDRPECWSAEGPVLR